MRIEDVGVGDVVNREPDSQTGWFEVAEATSLFNDDIQLADRTELLTISGPFFTIVGVQFVSEAEVPDQPPSPLPSIAGEGEDEGEDEGDAEKPAEADQAAPANPFANKADRSVPASETVPADQSASSDEDYGDQSHAEKGELPQLPSRQSQPSGAGALIS